MTNENLMDKITLFAVFAVYAMCCFIIGVYITCCMW